MKRFFSEKIEGKSFLAFFRVVASNQIFPHFENAKVGKNYKLLCTIIIYFLIYYFGYRAITLMLLFIQPTGYYKNITQIGYAFI